MLALIIGRFLKLYENELILNNIILSFIIATFFYSILITFASVNTAGEELAKLNTQLSNNTPKWKIFIKEFALKWGLFFVIPKVISYIYNIQLSFFWLLLIFLLVDSSYYLISKKSILDFILKIDLKNREKSKHRSKENMHLFAARILDLTIVFNITILLERLLNNWIFIHTIVLFLIVNLIYYFISYVYKHQTLGKYFFALEIKGNLKSFFKRELIYKYGIGIISPFAFLYLIGYGKVHLTALFIILINTFFAIIYYAFNKNIWWNDFANTSVLLNANPKPKPKYIMILLILGVSFISLLVYNNAGNNSKQNILGFNYPFKKIEYPDNSKLNKYTDFLSKNKFKNPKNYILDLFKKHDIVVLCEYDHNEDVQWDMIYEIVSDSVFIKDIGTIFTEYGSAKNQDKVNTYLSKNFKNDTSRLKSAATLMNYKAGNFYRFMTRLNKLNDNLSDSEKVNLYFTDILYWKYLSYEKPPMDSLIKRDSLMADKVISWYSETKEKCLIITNYRHAFAINQKAIKQNPKEYNMFFSDNEAQYIYNSFPDNTANVMIYGLDEYNGFLSLPINKGKWAKALKIHSQALGFNLNGSPFGEDKFNLLPSFGKRIDFKFKDVFKGFVYYKSKDEHKYSEPLFEKYAAKQEFSNQKFNNRKDSLSKLKMIESYKDKYPKQENAMILAYLNLYHYLDIILFFLLNFITIFLAFCYGILEYFKHYKLKNKKFRT